MSTEPGTHVRLLLGVLTLLAYVALANTVEQLYPFSVFDMYANRAGSASKVVARSERGELSEVTDWVAWDCGGLVQLEPIQHEAGPHPYTIPYRDREALAWIRTHQRVEGAATGLPRPVQVVRHIWWLSAAPGQPAAEDRVLASCAAVADD